MLWGVSCLRNRDSQPSIKKSIFLWKNLNLKKIKIFKVSNYYLQLCAKFDEIRTHNLHNRMHMIQWLQINKNIPNHSLSVGNKNIKRKQTWNTYFFAPWESQEATPLWLSYSWGQWWGFLNTHLSPPRWTVSYPPILSPYCRRQSWRKRVRIKMSEPTLSCFSKSIFVSFICKQLIRMNKPKLTTKRMTNIR